MFSHFMSMHSTYRTRYNLYGRINCNNSSIFCLIQIHSEGKYNSVRLKKKKHINLKSLNVVLHLDRSVSFRVMWLTLTCQTTHFKECFLKDVIESSSCKVLMMNSNLLFTGNLKDMCSKNKKRIKLNCAILLLVCKNLPLICEESKNKLRKYYMGKDMISTNLDVTVSYLAWF